MLRWLCAGGVLTIALALYLWTLAPTVGLVDSGELILAAQTLGVAHPPGFPLYVALAHLASMLPLGNVAQRVNFFSAVCAASAVAVLAVVAAEVFEPAIPLLLLPALLLAFSRTLWTYATIAEVYALNTWLVLLVWWLMLRWRSRATATAAAGGSKPPAKSNRTHRGRSNPQPKSPFGGRSPTQPGDWVTRQRTDVPLYAAAFIFGLALGVHHVTVLLTLPALAALVYATAGFDFFASRRLATAALCAGAGLLIYAYLPLAAARQPVMNWGDPRTLQRLWWHVTGRQYRSYFVFSGSEMGKEAWDFVRRAGREFGPWWLPAVPLLVVLGFAGLWRRDRVLFAFLALVIACNLAYGLSYVIAEDKDAYNLPAFAAMALAAGYGAAVLLRAARAHAARAGAAVAALLLLVPLAGLAANFPFNNRRADFIAHDYADNVLRSIEPGGMLLTLDWQIYAPLLYVRQVEQQRRDAVIIDVNQLRRSWYFAYLRREYPQLMDATAGAVDAFLEDLVHWEQDPDAYARDPALTRRIDTRFTDMILAFVSFQMQHSAAYITQDLALNRGPQDLRLTQALTTTYQLVPDGLVFRLFADREFHAPEEPRLVTRGLADGTRQFEPDDVFRIKVFPVYVSMLYNRGRYLALHGQHAAAVAAFKASLALDPHFALAQQALAESSAAQRR